MEAAFVNKSICPGRIHERRVPHGYIQEKNVELVTHPNQLIFFGFAVSEKNAFVALLPKKN
jgi:hypothetical protein